VGLPARSGHNTVTYDASGNLTYDGVFKYAYDSWNRLAKVTKGYRDANGVQSGAEIAVNSYDGLGRRIVREIGKGDK
jgi:hypothetical protein